MTIYTITGVTGGGAVLLGDIRSGRLNLDLPLLIPLAVLTGDIRPTRQSIQGTIDAIADLSGVIIPSIPNICESAVELDALWSLRWSSHTPVIGASDLEADASFLRLGDTNAEGPPASIYGRVLGLAELEGNFVTGAVLSGTVDSLGELSQAFNFYDVGDSPLIVPIAVLTGSINVVGTRRSPPYAQFDGTNFLLRSTSDAALNPAGAFTVSVTFDPELIQPGQDCVVVAKNNQTGTQAGWKVTYTSATGIVTFFSYGAADGTVYVSRSTSTALRVRSRFTAIVDASGNVTLYVDGSTNQGAQSNAGSWSAPNASTEAFSMGCDEPSNSGTNRMYGAIYDFAFWSTDLTGGEAALLLPEGLLPEGVNTADLEVYWDSLAIVASPANGTFASWVDSIVGLTLLPGDPSGHSSIYCFARDSGILPSSPPLPLTHTFDSLLSDRSVVPPDHTLTTTHRLSVDTRWRLWSPGSITPQIPGLFRQYRGDFTLTVMLSKVSGAIDVVIAKLYGIRVEWQTTNSFFIVSGDDDIGSTNEVTNYTIALANGRSEPASSVVPSNSALIFTIRYNAFTKEVDIFQQGVRNGSGNLLTGQSAYERHTGLVLADFADFRLASFIPACLAETQIQQMLAGFNPAGFITDTQSNTQRYHAIPYGVWDVPLRPLYDSQSAERLLAPSSPTTISGVIPYASGGGVMPGSVRVLVPEATVDIMAYSDNGLGAFTADLGAQPVSSSVIHYVGVQATGSVSLSGLPADGDTVTLTSSSGFTSVTFEFDNNATVVGGNFLVTIGADATATMVNLRAAITQNPLLRITAGGSGTTASLTHQDARATVSNLIAIVGATLSKSDFSGGVTAGTWSITITGGGGEFSLIHRGRIEYIWISTGLNPIPELIPFDWIQVPLTQVYLTGSLATENLYADAPYIIKDGFDEPEPGTGTGSFLDPQPTIVSVTADTSHMITARVNAGPTDAGPVIMWWEIELIAGSTEVMVVADYFQPGSFSINRTHTDLFPIPAGQDWNEKRIRFVIQSLDDASQSWRSLFFRMLGTEFDNAPPEIIVVPGTPTTPGFGVGDLLTTEERERLVIARRARRATSTEPQSDESRYKTTKVFVGSRGLELGLMEVLDDLYVVGSDFRTYVVRSLDVGFLDRIAVLFYGDGFEWAWWSIAYANNMIDPDLEMFVGQRLIIPKREALQKFLARKPVTTLST